MVDLYEAVAGIEKRLDQHLQYIHTTAAASVPHGTPEWDYCLAFYRLTPPPQQTRLTLARELALSRGALPQEVRTAFYVVTLLTEGALARLPGLGDAAHQANQRASSTASTLRSRMITLVDAEGGKYERLIRPNVGSKAGVGGIFANVKRTAAMDPWAHLGEFDTGNVTLSCVACGAPQQVANDFACGFCGQFIFGEDPGYDT